MPQRGRHRRNHCSDDECQRRQARFQAAWRICLAVAVRQQRSRPWASPARWANLPHAGPRRFVAGGRNYGMTRFGPVGDAQGVRFRLWAPSANDVALEVEGRGLFPLSQKDGGWKETVVNCTPGCRYRFRLGDQVMPDPASRLQSGGVHGWSVVCAPFSADAAWSGRPWEETVLYECHAGLMGGFKGVAEKLPALADLGITAIELMPIAAFPGARNWGYDGVLPFAPA